MSGRLTRERWIEEGLTVLREEGETGLAADRLARRLGVSRGSFYWHFKSAGDFEAAIFGEYERGWTTEIIDAVERSSDDPRARLRALIEAAAGIDVGIYSAARRMAVRHAELAIVLARIDARRVGFLDQLLRDGGVPASDAALRAPILYAWAMGQMLTRSPGTMLPAGAADSLIAFAFGA